ncbi:hypothetical protein [Streptomyces sp. NPDC058861]|uniref:hypothetical protein n=1 Tax=Streptomyces sp. NPDC058861 TaxID=3346653 RepID=UPI0036ABB871
MLKEDLAALRRVPAKGAAWTVVSAEGAHHRIYAATGPWLGLARSRRDGTASPADRARWDTWISVLTPPEHLVPKSHADMCVLAGTARDMLRTLRQTLPPCPSVGSVTAEIERQIQNGTLAPGTAIRPAAVATSLRVPGEHVDLALADLAASGLVEAGADGRTVVTSASPGARRRAGGCGRQQGGFAGETRVSAA